jgi:hypothetical protein
MVKNGKTPIDQYSREDYEAGLALQEEIKEVLANPPHKEDLALFTELRGQEEGVFPFSEEEHQKRSEHDDVVERATEDEERVRNSLWRMLANAQKEAGAEDAHREYLELLPRIESAKGEINETLAKVSTLAPEGALREAGEVVRMGDELAQVLKGERPVPPRTIVRQLIDEFLRAKEYVLSKLRKFLGTQNKFGGPIQPA